MFRHVLIFIRIAYVYMRIRPLQKSFPFNNYSIDVVAVVWGGRVYRSCHYHPGIRFTQYLFERRTHFSMVLFSKSITSLARLQYGKDEFLFLWEGATLHLSRAHTAVLIHTKFRTIVYVDEMKKIVRFVGIGQTGAHVGEIYNFQILVYFSLASCLVNSPTGHNSQQISMHASSKNAL